MKANKSLHTKIEGIFQSLNFKIRYEKGTFKSGYCILEDQKVIVINKFFPLESKISTLLEILKVIEVDASRLDPGQNKLIQKLKQTELTF